MNKITLLQKKVDYFLARDLASLKRFQELAATDPVPAMIQYGEEVMRSQLLRREMEQLGDYVVRCIAEHGEAGAVDKVVETIGIERSRIVNALVGTGLFGGAGPWAHFSTNSIRNAQALADCDAKREFYARLGELIDVLEYVEPAAGGC